jgi:hypothetical protein
MCNIDITISISSFHVVYICFGQARATHLSGQNWKTAFEMKIVADFLNNFRFYEDAVSTARSNVIVIFQY